MHPTSATRIGAAVGNHNGGPTRERWVSAQPHLPMVIERPVQALSENPEANLLASIARGDVDAFSQLYDRFAGTLFSIAFRILQDYAAAEDVVQEAFVQLWEKAANYQPALGKPLTWAVTLVRNRAIDRLRSVQRSHRLVEAATEEQEANAEADAADTRLLNEETARTVHRALAALGAEQRQAIEMAYFAGLSQTEIAAALGVPLGTVKARIRRGMLQLRAELELFL